MKEVLLLTDKVDQVGQLLSQLSEEVQNHDRRFVRLEILLEIAKIRSLTY